MVKFHQQRINVNDRMFPIKSLTLAILRVNIRIDVMHGYAHSFMVTPDRAWTIPNGHTFSNSVLYNGATKTTGSKMKTYFPSATVRGSIVQNAVRQSMPTNSWSYPIRYDHEKMGTPKR